MFNFYNNYFTIDRETIDSIHDKGPNIHDMYLSLTNYNNLYDDNLSYDNDNIYLQKQGSQIYSITNIIHGEQKYCKNFKLLANDQTFTFMYSNLTNYLLTPSQLYYVGRDSHVPTSINRVNFRTDTDVKFRYVNFSYNFENINNYDNCLVKYNSLFPIVNSDSYFKLNYGSSYNQTDNINDIFYSHEPYIKFNNNYQEIGFPFLMSYININFTVFKENISESNFNILQNNINNLSITPIEINTSMISNSYSYSYTTYDSRPNITATIKYNIGTTELEILNKGGKGDDYYGPRIHDYYDNKDGTNDIGYIYGPDEINIFYNDIRSGFNKFSPMTYIFEILLHYQCGSPGGDITKQAHINFVNPKQYQFKKQLLNTNNIDAISAQININSLHYEYIISDKYLISTYSKKLPVEPPTSTILSNYNFCNDNNAELRIYSPISAKLTQTSNNYPTNLNINPQISSNLDGITEINNTINTASFISNNVNPYQDEYFSLYVYESGTIIFSTSNLQYKQGNGSWTNLNANTAISVTHYSGSSNDYKNIIKFRNRATPNSGTKIGTFSGTAQVIAFGNIMSLLYGDNFINQNSLSGHNNIFDGLFLNNTSIVSAKFLYLPAITLSNNCYDSMFMRCTNLIMSPYSLLTNNLAPYCYNCMFSECTNLINSPKLPATILADSCYRSMFNYCTSLIYIPKILPATTLEVNCYNNMFANCSSLKEAPQILGTTLADNCCLGMFFGCTSLKKAPKLTAINLVSHCYDNMFDGCTSLNYINCNAVNGLPPIESNAPCTDHWTYNVAEYGFFVQNDNAVWVRGENGIPYGWLTIYENNIYNYLTFEIIEDCTIAFNGYQGQSLQFRTSGSPNWQTFNGNGTSISFSKGISIQFKATGLAIDNSDTNDNTIINNLGIGTFVVTSEAEDGCFNIFGNIMSLLYGDDFADKKTLSGKICVFCKLFEGCSGLVSAKNLILPAEYLSNGVYISMFKDCTSLIETPTLPATTLLSCNNCYRQMFMGCTSLKTMPELPATIIAVRCYQDMFNGCTSLIHMDKLPATTLQNYCYQDMFNGCTSLLYYSHLPATTLGTYCYYGMFANCTSLKWCSGQNNLPAQTLATYCYNGMFSGCTSLQIAPHILATTCGSGTNCCREMFMDCTSLTEYTSFNISTLGSHCCVRMFKNCTSLLYAPTILPATTLAEYCYYEMFSGCTSLRTAPTLTANTLVNSCYAGMFMGCTSLNYIKCLATNISATNCKGNWVRNVAPIGVFCTPYAGWPRGNSGIPTNWIIESSNMQMNYLTFEALEDNVQFHDWAHEGDLYYSINNGSWTLFDGLTPYINRGDIIKWKMTSPTYCPRFEWDGATGKFKVYGNVMSLLYGDNFANQVSLANKPTFEYMFQTNQNLIDANDLCLPATTLNHGCYTCMFNGCTNLIYGPKELPANDLTAYCYSEMFRDCSSLLTTPILPAERLNDHCYNEMFRGCSSLLYISNLPATTLATKCYSEMFRDCTSLGKIPELPATTLAEYCYFAMFRGCTSLITIPSEDYLPATTLQNNCYAEMFHSCTSLKNMPELHATTLNTHCYDSMFQDCFNLSYAEPLPATTLASYCYFEMFEGCSSLINPPTISAQTLASHCCDSMFQDCSNLKSSPKLDATTLVDNCYTKMFSGCTNLSSIRCFATNITTSNASNYILNWTSGVIGDAGERIGKAQGTFYCANTTMVSIWNSLQSASASYVPRNWSILLDLKNKI